METTLIQKLVSQLQCPKCSGQMVPPLIHCPEGHHYCCKCISDNGICQKCQLPLGSRRNYSLENMCFNYSLKCSFAPDGCLFTGTGIVVAEHESSCEVSQKPQRNLATSSGEAIRPIEDSNGKSLEKALFAELECPVCLLVILPPIGECSNGHQICHDCYKRVEDCPICRIPKTYTINIILGNILEIIVISCRNAGEGCEVRGSAPSVLKHEKTCDFVVKLCPLTIGGNCKWRGAMRHLVKHCKDTHSDRLTLTSVHTCVSDKFENQLSYHNLFYINGVLFRFGWYASGAFYRFSVHSFGYVKNDKNYMYEIRIFHITSKFLAIRLREPCAVLEDGDIKCFGKLYIEISQEQLANCFSDCGEITYDVEIY